MAHPSWTRLDLKIVFRTYSPCNMLISGLRNYFSLTPYEFLEPAGAPNFMRPTVFCPVVLSACSASKCHELLGSHSSRCAHSPLRVDCHHTTHCLDDVHELIMDPARHSSCLFFLALSPGVQSRVLLRVAFCTDGTPGASLSEETSKIMVEDED